MNKTLTLSILFLFLFIVANANAGTYNATCDYVLSWDLTGLNYTGSYESSKETQINGVFLNPDGTKMYTIGQNGDTIDEYDLSQAWNISTATYVQEISVSAKATSPISLFIKPDGTKVWITNYQTAKIYEYTMSTPWNISTATYTTELSLSATIWGNIYFDNAGQKLFATRNSGGVVLRYDLSQAWNLSTAVNTVNYTNSLFLSPFWFSPDGTKVFSGTDNILYQFNLSQAWNLSTAVNTVNATWYSITGVDQTIYMSNTTPFIYRGTYNKYVTQAIMNYTLNCTDPTPTDLIEIISPTAQNYTTQNVMINISNKTSMINIDKIWYNWNGTNVTYTVPVNTTFPAGEYTLQAWANNTAGTVQNVNVTFYIYLYPATAIFNHSNQLVRNDSNVLLSWSVGNDTFPLLNQTLYIFDNSNNLVANYSLANTTTTYNYTNSIPNVYYAIVETCNTYPLCINSSSSNKFSFQSISFIDWPTLVTSLETYNIRASVSSTNVLLSGEDDQTFSNSCHACIGEPNTTSYRMGSCGNETGNLLYCDGSMEDPPYEQYVCISWANPVCKYSNSSDDIIIFRNGTEYNATYVSPYFQKSFTTTLYENVTYPFTARASYLFEGNTFNLFSDTENLTIYNFSIGLCNDTDGYLNFTIVNETEQLETGSIGTHIIVEQPLGEINATLNQSTTGNLKFCITPKKNYYINADIYYQSDGVERLEEYYLSDALYNFSNNNKLYLYSLYQTDILNVQVLDEFSQKEIGAVVNLVKFYPDTFTSKTIGSAKTNSEGVVNFFYDNNDLIKLVAVRDGEIVYEDPDFNKYYSSTGYYTRTLKIGGAILPSIDMLIFSCVNDKVSNTSTVTCNIECTDNVQRNYTLIVYDSTFGNVTTTQTQSVFTCNGQLELSTTATTAYYELKIENITRLSGVVSYNFATLPIEIKFFVYPLLIMVTVLGTINPVFAVAGYVILGLFAHNADGTMLFFSTEYLVMCVGAVLILLFIEEMKSKKK